MAFSELSKNMQELPGLRVTSKTIAGNSIWLWFGENKEKGIYIDPPWRLLSGGEIIGSSADFPWEKLDGESDAEYRQRFESACDITDCIKGAPLIGSVIDQATSDIHLTFEGGYQLCSFTVWRHEENWLFVDHDSKLRYRVSARGVEIEAIGA